ncbi:MAG: 4Fe-4S dicluster domain-containing protein [Sedimentisphaerales bacterium]|nr:4Fe-4S dicluster domain-containing protein [Sedimentisphaerales bacterium]
MGTEAKILFCNCAYSDVVDRKVKSRIAEALRSEGIAFEAVGDLCKLAADGDPRMGEWAQCESLQIVACYERTIQSLFSRLALHLPDGGRVWNMRTMDPDRIVSELLAEERAKGSMSGSLEKDGPWMPWYPVIDYERCTGCKQCFNFCLFGVFGLDVEGKVRVVKPSGCKTYCPACARVCPQRAIIFPKSEDSPMNGDVVDEDALAAERASGQVKGLTADQMRRLLRTRSGEGKRFATDDDREQQANEKRKVGVNRLQEELGIPAKVLASLSAEEIAGIRDRRGLSSKGNATAPEPCEDPPCEGTSDE